MGRKTIIECDVSGEVESAENPMLSAKVVDGQLKLFPATRQEDFNLCGRVLETMLDPAKVAEVIAQVQKAKE